MSNRLIALLALALVVLPPTISNDAWAVDANQKPISFRLKKGRGLPVCEAYLQRLNISGFEEPAYCGRPESDAVPGFKILHREDLSSEEIIHMSGMLDKDWTQPNPHLTGSRDADPRTALGIVAWRYREPLDLGNDSHPLRVMVWQGYGLSGGPQCGWYTGDPSTPGFRPRQMPLILNDDNKTIDKEATFRYFAGHGVPAWVKGKSWVPEGSHFPFRPIGRSIGIFNYRGQFYYDTFFDLSGDHLGNRSGRASLANVLGVFHRANNTTTEVCELKMSGSDYPKENDLKFE